MEKFVDWAQWQLLDEIPHGLQSDISWNCIQLKTDTFSRRLDIQDGFSHERQIKLTTGYRCS